MSNYIVNFDYFSGPLDLLLHLVQREEVGVENVEISLIATRYLRTVCASVVLNLDFASEHLVLASTLLAIKSSRLLPDSSNDAPAVGIDENGNDFYENLRERLKEYNLVKSRARFLLVAPQLDVDVFTRPSASPVSCTANAEYNCDLNVLRRSFFNLSKRLLLKNYRMEVEADSFPISYYITKIALIYASMPKKTTVTFKDLCYIFDQNTGSTHSPKSLVVGAFTAILELTKRGEISIVREACYDSNMSFSIQS